MPMSQESDHEWVSKRERLATRIERTADLSDANREELEEMLAKDLASITHADLMATFWRACEEWKIGTSNRRKLAETLRSC